MIRTPALRALKFASATPPTLPPRAGPRRSRRTRLPLDTTFGVSWRNIGPNQSGRMVAVAGTTARPTRVLFRHNWRRRLENR